MIAFKLATAVRRIVFKKVEVTVKVRDPFVTRSRCQFVALVGWLILPEIAAAFSITGVTLTPPSPIPVGSNMVMTVHITTPSSPPGLYQPSSASVRGNQVFIDLYPTSGLLTVPGRLSTNVNLGLLPGGAYEYEVRLHPEFPANVGVRTNHGTFVVLPDYPWTMATVTAPDPEAAEPGVLAVINPGRFRVHRSGVTNVDLLVCYRLGGTASNGVDYAAISNAVFIPAGQGAADIVINPRHDLLPEGTETVALRLLAPACPAIYPPPPECYLVGTPREAVVHIADHPLPTNHPPFVNFFSPADGDTYTAPADVHLAAYAEDSEDGYQLTVQFFNGNRSLGFGTFVPSMCPAPICPNYSLIWSNVPAGEYDVMARVTDQKGARTDSRAVRIKVLTPLPTNLLPVVTIHARDPLATEGTNCYRWPGWPTPLPANGSGTNTATFAVHRTGDTSASLTVHYQISGTASNGLDYGRLSGTVVIPAGQRIAPITVWPLDDVLVEGIETVVLGVYELPLGSPLPPPYAVGKPARAVAIIVDNDQCRPVTGRLPDNCFHLAQPGHNGAWFRIECSSNLVHWTSLGTNIVTDGAIHFVDPEADTVSHRFYRAVPELRPPTE